MTKNQLEDISGTQSIAAVLLRGQWLTKAQLAVLLAEYTNTFIMPFQNAPGMPPAL
ncbi:hypothetical protein ACFL43_05640 [Thermodesulfobacteriota bacterium]